MQKITVTRNDNLYEAFADIAQAADGTLVCTYRESMCHSYRPFSRIVIRRSFDRGRSWGPRQVVCECSREDTEAGRGMLNCSRLTACGDGTLLLIVDAIDAITFADLLEPDPCRNLIFRSRDCGATWEGPEETGITAGIVPSIAELSSGDLLVGVTEQFEGNDPGRGFSESQTIYRSTDGGATWEGPTVIPNPSAPTANGEKWRLNEGDFAEMDDGRVVVYMREDGERLSGWKSLSSDAGCTWSEPVRTQMPCCLGRPSVGRLRSGEVALTYRMAVGRSTSLALYVETAAEAVRGLGGVGARGMDDYSSTAESRFAVIDNDRSPWADSGYSGWVQLEDGDLFVVNYVNDDAPRAFVRGYVVGREDWNLYPEGQILSELPYDWEGAYVGQMQDLARRQQAWVDAQDWSGQVLGRKKLPSARRAP